jgi:Fe-S-cluster containining protein
MRFTLHKPTNLTPIPIDCGACNKCCKGNTLVVITENDRQDFYVTQTYKLPDGRVVEALQFQANGDCFYLIDGKCSIHGEHPLVCQAFNCMAEFCHYSRQERRLLIKQGMLSADVLDEGRKRLQQK